MEGSHYRQRLNPAFIPNYGYVNIPAIGAAQASVHSSSLGYQDIVDIMENSQNDDYFMSDDFMGRLSNLNELNVSANADIVSAGWYKGKNFWSFNIGVRNDIGASIPRSMFSFLRTMNGLDPEDIRSMSDINETVGKQAMDLNSYTEIGVGFARPINNRLSVGGKVKMLLGVGNLKLKVNDISVQSQLTGIDLSNNPTWGDLTYEQLQNIRGNASIRIDAELESSSKMLELPESEEGYIDEIKTGSFGFAGYGAAIDLGASYKLLDCLTVSASLLDLGFIKWNKSRTTFARSSNNQSYNLEDANDRYDFVDLVSSGEILNFDLLQLRADEGAAKSRSTGLTSTLAIGAEYRLPLKWLTVGALYTSRFAQPKTLNELTFSGNIQPNNNLGLSLSYSVIQGAGKTFGAALKLGPLFIGTDYMFLGKSCKNVNAFVGLSIAMNKQKKAAKSEEL